MPIQVYECPRCGDRHERLQPGSEHLHLICSQCNIEMKQIISAGSFVLKGAGFYVNDYKKNRSASQWNIA